MLRSSATLYCRLYSTQVATRVPRDSGISKTKLKNGLTVVTVNGTNNNISNTSIFVKAGSRFENCSQNPGISHCLRVAACLTTSKTTVWQATQALGSLGGQLDVVGTREHIVYNLKSGRRVWRDLMTEVLAPCLRDSEFYWWEMKDLTSAMQHQIEHAKSDPAFRLVEAVHKASFRGGLGNSVLCNTEMVENHSSEMIKDYFNSNFLPERMVLVGSGVNHDELCDVGDSALTLDTSGTPLAAPSDFISSEVREHVIGGLTHVGLSFPGSSLNDEDALALGILQNILGSCSHVKRSSGPNGRLQTAVGKKMTAPYAISTYNMNYSDSGILGIYMKSQGEFTEELVKSVCEEITSVAKSGVSEKEVMAGKQALKAAILMNVEGSDGMVNDVGIQVSSLDGYVTPDEIVAKIDAVTPSQVANAAKKTLGGSKSLAVVGDTSSCPYLCDL